MDREEITNTIGRIYGIKSFVLPVALDMSRDWNYDAGIPTDDGSACDVKTLTVVHEALISFLVSRYACAAIINEEEFNQTAIAKCRQLLRAA